MLNVLLYLRACMLGDTLGSTSCASFLEMINDPYLDLLDALYFLLIVNPEVLVICTYDTYPFNTATNSHQDILLYIILICSLTPLVVLVHCPSPLVVLVHCPSKGYQNLTNVC